MSPVSEMLSILILSRNSSTSEIANFINHARSLVHDTIELAIIDDGIDLSISAAIRDIAIKNGPLRIIRTPYTEEMESLKHAINRVRSDFQIILRPFIKIDKDAPEKLWVAMRRERTGWVSSPVRVGDKVIGGVPDLNVIGTGSAVIAPVICIRRQMIAESTIPGRGTFPHQMADHLLRKRIPGSLLADPLYSVDPVDYEKIANMKYIVTATSTPPQRPRITPGPSLPRSEPVGLLAPPPIMRGGTPRPVRPTRPQRTVGSSAGATSIDIDIKVKYPDVLVVVPLGEGMKETVASVKANSAGTDYEIMVVGQMPADRTIAKWIVNEGLRAVLFPEGKDEWAGLLIAAKICEKSKLLFMRPGLLATPGWMSPLCESLKNGRVLVAPVGNIGEVPQRIIPAGDPVVLSQERAQKFSGQEKEYPNISGDCFLVNRSLVVAPGTKSTQDMISKGWQESTTVIRKDSMVFYPKSSSKKTGEETPEVPPPDSKPAPDPDINK